MRSGRLLVPALLAACLATGAACRSIDFDHPRTESVAFTGTEDTDLGRIALRLGQGRPPEQSGFHMIPSGIEAFSARMVLARRAERCIDLQYYLIKDDLTGRALLAELLAAADRGVRVRFLLDDMFTAGHDADMAALDAHPGFELRVFNPFARGFGGRARSATTDFGRINRRMHNKSFTVDNQWTILGGRNLADEYFGAREDSYFGDLDVLCIGPVVEDTSAMFDAYWNHPTALPVPAFGGLPAEPQAELERLRDALATAPADLEGTRFGGVLEDVTARLEHGGPLGLHWAPYDLVYDSPDKGIRAKADEAASIRGPLTDALQAAQERVLILSPYFVPRDSGIEFLSSLEERGVEVTVITNSLAANNQLAVHAGYSPARKPLLRSGVELHEVRPDAGIVDLELVAASGASTTLHTKAFLVDADTAFIGSFNFDPRSAYLNTECGVVIESPELAAELQAIVDAALPGNTYVVTLDDDGSLRWRTEEDGQQLELSTEPGTTWFQRCMIGILRLLPIRGQL